MPDYSNVEEIKKIVRDRFEELVQSEQRFRIMVEAIKDYSIVMLDAEGDVLTWNDGAALMKGFTSAEVLGKHFSKFYSRTDVEAGKPEAALKEALVTGKMIGEFNQIRKDGSVFWASIIITPMWEDEKLLGFVQVTFDLTERQKHEKKFLKLRDDLSAQIEGRTRQLAESRDQLDIILSGISDGITVQNDKGDFIYVNDSGAQICGFSSAPEMLKIPTAEIIKNFEFRNEAGDPLSFECLPDGKGNGGADGAVEKVLCFRLKSTGAEKWLLFRSRPIFDVNKKKRLTVNIFKDFSERKKSEDTLKYLDEASGVLASSLDFKRTLTAIAQLAVRRIADMCLVQTDGTGPHTVTVQGKDPVKLELFKEMLSKYPPSKIEKLGSGNVVRSGKSELYGEVTEESMRAYAQNEDHYNLVKNLGFESALIVPLISRGKVLGALSLISSTKGKRFTAQDLAMAEELARRGGVAIDNSLLFAQLQDEKKKHELAHKEMEILAARAKAASEAKSLFLANMSHEIRTPLGVILGFTDLINDRQLTETEREKYTDVINRNGRQLTQLIDDILDLSKVEAGHLDIETVEMSLPILLSDLVIPLRLRAQEKGLTLELISEKDVPEIIYSDPTRLRQILNNIIGNALKFTDIGGVKIRVNTSDELEGKYIIFSVEDSGMGIASESKERLFEWFTQGDASTTRKFGGTGLGLALSRRLARALGGDIRIDDAPKRGSKFIISILSKKPENAAIRKPAPSSGWVPRAPTTNDLSGLRILIVEDSPDNRMLIESILTRQGIIVESAQNGREGVDKALSGNFDLILMDIQMPVYDGFQATAELRQKGYKKPIVALTAHAMKEEREKTLATGADAHLTKPLDVAKLFNVIAEFTRQNRK